MLVTDTGYEVLTLSAGSPPPPAFVGSLKTVMAERARPADARRRRPAAWPSCARSFRQGKAALLAALRRVARHRASGHAL